MVLYKLLSVTDLTTNTVDVISLTDIGSTGKKIETLGVPVRALNMRGGIGNLLLVLKLATWLKRSKPDIIQTWMYHADLLGGIAAKFAGGIPLAWGIHNSNLNPALSKRSTIWTAKLCAMFSHWLPSKIVCVSDGARNAHEAIGYSAEKMTLIPNGIDTAAFKPNRDCRISVRQELGIGRNTILIGLIARFDPQKDHHSFIKAAKLLSSFYPKAHFLLCGDGIDWENENLVSWIDNEGLRRCFHLLGLRDDIPRLTAALDIASSSSFGESFSLTLGEAMAC
ncbi:MAG TPA: glycosyltransferase, partial [Bacteroidetes bacterium]|nr:glycosyltransferase [Bacteroidota bacterium]